MEWQVQSDTNSGLIQQLQDFGVIKNEMVATVMKQTDRRFYCRTANCYVDQPQQIGTYATFPAPHAHAYALESLANHIHPNSKILDIGCGTGYLTACFARLIQAKARENLTAATGTVYAVDYHPKLIEFAVESLNLDDQKLIKNGRVKIFQSGSIKACTEFGPFDVIHVGVASNETPSELLSQLNLYGRMLCSVGPRSGSHIMEQYDRISTSEVSKKILANEIYIPIIESKDE
ncbi:hypothetical protein PVAND_016360 [Polypedilum vanderplanki]|uniref:protein-L-isoaspartate(D-aspartate) O-methyltransferase n=1 Tax=Polypedilum vanderplanki TaxID=319348 RepID=S6BEH1_POLVA|nr:hypothetical protein PVAND_016360 [Polypedilum vanderplanki]BAN67561.1 protein L-isoaspartyl methyltransferase [Polypedilum vanderplanki]